MVTELLQWHPGFVDTFKVEAYPDVKKMELQSEYQLGMLPKEVDILAVKQDERYECERDVTRIFRKHNLVEYKNPNQSLSVNDYYRVLGYTNFYIGDAKHVLEVHPNEVTITFVCNRYPRNLLRHLEETKAIRTENAAPGIYYLDGSEFPVQIIICHELDPERNLWLYSLRDNLTKEELERVLWEYEQRKQDKRYEAAIELIIRANWRMMEAMKGMCKALEELMADRLKEMEEEGWKRGHERGMQQGIQQGMQQGMQQFKVSLIKKKLDSGKTIAEISEVLEEDVSVIEMFVREITQASA